MKHNDKFKDWFLHHDFENNYTYVDSFLASKLDKDIYFKRSSYIEYINDTKGKVNELTKVLEMLIDRP